MTLIMKLLRLTYQISVCLLCVLVCSGCSSPTDKFFRYADSYNLSQDQLSASEFQLQIFSNQILSDNLNIYLDGDGSPWLKGRYPAFDPTPRNLLTLQLMQKDTHSAVYIGRPCYFELGPSQRCNSLLWTHERYSQDIVTAMDAAIDQLVSRYNPEKVQLIGFSGGGALAVLIANRRDDISSVITVAGNLDPELWVQIHGYLPLKGSLNPASLPSLTIPSLHLSGALDQAVPSKIAQSYLSNHSGFYWQFPSFDHHCCWLDTWPEILEKSNELFNSEPE